MNVKTLLPILPLLFILCACGESEIKQTPSQAVAIEATDECHLCGMLISEFPGPKAELLQTDTNSGSGKKIHKFCSTRDMFSYYLEPENTRNVSDIFVHDMSKTPWHKPADNYFINARKAWYVAGSSQQGAMGNTLASFATEQDAINFQNEFGGHVIRFEDITHAILMPAHH
ncbi:nitrous oxide reductase accessory protein NosL [Pseudoalteromonas lipolytica]|uniref:Copper chaperone NosL n=1 Tax=Pseudoalteromonas lipolytica TaxID=570156 RepID=A0ABY1GGB4_9GAMM|nr:nitrous oxide reductase accessory protein NosL [Pseudoalteromonas lipolytica]MBE0353045.1 hypothetical protein [Pseudoalteromonas lipolytica LMEB 39]SFT54206.1 copper chaperone NosL [Pseudoalteromonas lipolytica]